MACFVVPGTEAIVVTAAALLLKRYEKKKTEVKIGAGGAPAEPQKKTGFARKLFWLADLLWGGVILLAFEHLWHGEVVPFFPFLTAASEGPQAVAEMLGEMASVGVTMAVLVTAVWVGMVLISAAIEKRPEAKKAEADA